MQEVTHGTKWKVFPLRSMVFLGVWDAGLVLFLLWVALGFGIFLGFLIMRYPWKAL